MIKIDIILISYNQEQYIQEAVESIFTQKVNDNVRLRLIVADDFSVDNTLSIIHSAVPLLLENSLFVEDVIFLSTNHNLGINRNYQRAFAACDGDYIAIMEGDDYWTKDYHLQQHIDFLQTHPECSMSMNRFIYTYNGCPETMRGWHAAEDYELFSLKDQIEWNNVLGNLSACVLRTSCVKKIPEKNFSVYMDDFLLGISLATFGNLCVLRDVTSVYRGNSNSLYASSRMLKRIMRHFHFIRVYDKLYDGKYHAYFKIGLKRYVKEIYGAYKHKLVNKNRI